MNVLMFGAMGYPAMGTHSAGRRPRSPRRLCSITPDRRTPRSRRGQLDEKLRIAPTTSCVQLPQGRVNDKINFPPPNAYHERAYQDHRPRFIHAAASTARPQPRRSISDGTISSES